MNEDERKSVQKLILDVLEERTNRLVQRFDISRGFESTLIRFSRRTDVRTADFSTADLVVSGYFSWNPDGLDQIDNISRWFPEEQIKIPLIGIRIQNTISVETEFLGDSASPRVEIMATTITDDEGGQGNLVSSSPRELGKYRINGSRQKVKDSTLIEDIEVYLKNLNRDTVVDRFQLAEKVNQFDPSIFHFEEVLHAYNQDRDKILVILLSVFFEDYINNEVEEELENLRMNDHAGRFYSDWKFKESLDAARFFGVITDKEYGTIDQIRDERNDYAHNFDDFHAKVESQVVQSGILEKGIELYERIIGVEKSMLD